MEPGAVMASRGAYNVRGQMPQLPSLLKVPFGYGSIYLPDSDDVSSVESLLEYCEDILEINALKDEESPFEWDGEDSWIFTSWEDELIEAWCTAVEGEPATDYMEVFIDAVEDAYESRRPFFHGYTIDQLVEYWAPHYRIIGSGWFSKEDAGQVSVVGEQEADDDEPVIVEDDDYSEEHY